MNNTVYLSLINPSTDAYKILIKSDESRFSMVVKNQYRFDHPDFRGFVPLKRIKFASQS